MPKHTPTARLIPAYANASADAAKSCEAGVGTLAPCPGGRRTPWERGLPARKRKPAGALARTMRRDSALQDNDVGIGDADGLGTLRVDAVVADGRNLLARHWPADPAT